MRWEKENIALVSFRISLAVFGAYLVAMTVENSTASLSLTWETSFLPLDAAQSRKYESLSW